MFVRAQHGHRCLDLVGAANIEGDKLGVGVADVGEPLLRLFPLSLLFQELLTNLLQGLVLGLVPASNLSLVVSDGLIDFQDLAHLLVHQLLLQALELLSKRGLDVLHNTLQLRLESGREVSNAIYFYLVEPNTRRFVDGASDRRHVSQRLVLEVVAQDATHTGGVAASIAII